MKNKTKIVAVILITVLTFVFAAGCGSSKTNQKESTKKNITIGVRSDLVGMYKVIKPVLEKKGYKPGFSLAGIPNDYRQFISLNNFLN